MNRISLLFVAVFGSFGSNAAEPQDRERELSYLRCIMPESLPEFAHVEVATVENIAILGEGTSHYLGLHLFPAPKKLNGGVRAEVSIDYPFRSGDTVRYAWRFKVPDGFQSDAPKNRWWIIGQQFPFSTPRLPSRRRPGVGGGSTLVWPRGKY